MNKLMSIYFHIIRKQSFDNAKSLYNQMRLEEIAMVEIYNKSVEDNQHSDLKMRRFEMDEKQKKYEENAESFFS